jgi:ABC-2 type transport system permease protein
MFHRLKIEWLKLKGHRPLWMLLALYVLSIFGVNYIIYHFQQSVYNARRSGEFVRMLAGSAPYSFPTVWQMTSFISSFMLVLPGILLIISITNEYAFKTHRQNIIDGWSRSQFITTKIALAFILAVLSTIFVFLAGLTFGYMDGSHPLDFGNFEYLGYFFLQSLSYCMVALLMATLLKAGGIAIGAYLLYAVMIENILAGIINRYTDHFGRYLPLEASDTLIPMPLFKIVQRELVTPPNTSVLLAVAIGYLIVFALVVTHRFEKADL